MSRKISHALILGGMLALTGCASGGGGEEPAADMTISERLDSRIAIEVRNDLLPRVSVILKLRAPGRPLKTLGTVLSDATETFVVDTSDIAAGYVLIAERPGRTPMISERITAISRAKITWNLGIDLLRVERL